MSRRIAVLLATLGLALALASVFAAAPVALAGDPCFHEMTRPPATTRATTQVTIADCVFGPTVTHVAVGSKVTWRNRSTQSHEVVGAHLAWGGHDKLLGQGDSIAWAFDTPGVYPYSCMLHPGMTGAVVVGDGVAVVPAADAEAAPAPPDEPADSAAAGATGQPQMGTVAAIGAGAVLAALATVIVIRRRQPSAV